VSAISPSLVPVHDAVRHVNALRLSLSQDKAPLALLLAAGCPVAVRVDSEPLIPDIAGMTAKLATTLSAGSAHDAFVKLLACLDADGVADANLESWLSQVRALRSVAEGGAVRELSKEELDELERAITDGIVDLVERVLPAPATPFHGVAAWAGAVERTLPVEIFTTNYDLLLEQAFESMRRPYFDGYVGAREPFFDNASVAMAGQTALPSRFTRLWKLHGSVNWYLTGDGRVVRSQVEAGRRRLIHPSHLKYDESRQMPYLALLDRLRAFLNQRGALLVTCGYSFGDRHINVVLADGLQANPTASLVGLAHGPLARYAHARRLADLHSNFSLYARDGAVVGTREGGWRRDRGAEDVHGVEDDGTCTVTLGDFAAFGVLLQSLLDRSHHVAS
jgi:hypothetical protein